MEIFIVIIEDRHCDVTAHPFSNQDKAIEYAKAKAKEYCRYEEDYEEEDIDGWIFYAKYSCESDSVRVVKTTLDKE